MNTLLEKIQAATNANWVLETRYSIATGYTYTLRCDDSSSEFYTKEFEHDTMNGLEADVSDFLN